jgi:uncharacterized protein
MAQSFIQLAHRGNNQGWRYFVGSLLALLSFLIPGSLLTVGLLSLYVVVDGNPATRISGPNEAMTAGLPVVGVGSLALYVFYNLSFLLFLLGIYLAIHYLHGRSLRTLITPATRINWRRIAQGFSVFFLLKVIELMVGYVLSPSDFTLNYQPQAFWLFVAWLMVLTPLQIATEELFFRGYLLQGIGSKFGKWMAILLPSLLFMLLHGLNPEVLSQAGWEGVLSLLLYYFMVGAFLAWLTIKDDSSELALGVHAANNMAIFLFITSPNSVIPSPALFRVSDIEAGFGGLFLTALLLLIFSYVVFRLLKRPLLAE